MNGILLLKFPLVATLLVFVSSGCAGGDIGEEGDVDIEVDFESQPAAAAGAVEAINPNALNPNALNPNALNPNAINPNALDPAMLRATPLKPESLDPAALQAIQAPDGALSRDLLRYVVSCALDETDTFNFSWTDAQGAVHQESYPGLLALAPLWKQTPLNAIGQQWISACLASRVNWYGVSVTISSRGAHGELENPTAEEINTYTVTEGAFWGNLFDTEPHLYACYTAANVDHARENMRDCAAGHVSADPATGETVIENCGIVEIVGPCGVVCDPAATAGQFYPKCSQDPPDSNPKVPYVITTFLP